MSFPKVLFIATIALFLGIGIASVMQKGTIQLPSVSTQAKKEIIQVTPLPIVKETPIVEPAKIVKIEDRSGSQEEKKVDRIRGFFSKGHDKLPIVETITYTSRVPWLKGRPAWIADYASRYSTSRHFIARGLNGKVDYTTQKVSPGDKFNVLRMDKNFSFYLLADIENCLMHFYYLDHDLDQRVLLKTYQIGAGRQDPLSPSGSLTPTGKFQLGDKVGIYKSGVMGFFQNQKVEMVNIFGTRWLPFESELEECTDSAKGYGIHGVPCELDPETGRLVEKMDEVGSCTSDGCIRLLKDDIEELFSIVISRPTVIEITRDIKQVTLPMNEEYYD